LSPIDWIIGIFVVRLDVAISAFLSVASTTILVVVGFTVLVGLGTHLADGVAAVWRQANRSLSVLYFKWGMYYESFRALKRSKDEDALAEFVNNLRETTAGNIEQLDSDFANETDDYEHLFVETAQTLRILNEYDKVDGVFDWQPLISSARRFGNPIAFRALIRWIPSDDWSHRLSDELKEMTAGHP
jgi:hypothetical protein